MAIKLLVTDMDGTLLGKDGYVSPRNRGALERVKQQGVKIVLASGRMTESMLPCARVLGVNAPMIAYNGAVIYDMAQSKIRHQTLIPMHWARALCETAENMGLHVQAYQHDGYYAAASNRYTKLYAAAIHHPEPHMTDRPLSGWINADQIKLLIIDEPKIVAHVTPILAEMFEGRIQCVDSQPNYIECIAIGAEKGLALRRVAEEMGILPDEIVAFGDAGNDIGMLSYAGLSYAMEGASDKVKNAADRVAPPAHRDGIACAIEELLGERRFFN